MLIIGSVAMAYHGLSRKTSLKDLDVICWPSEADQLRGLGEVKRDDGKKLIVYLKGEEKYIEAEIANAGTSAEMLLERYSVEGGLSPEYATKDVLYALKMSHRHLKNNPHFLKTMYDIHLMRKAWSCVSLEFDEVYSKEKWYEKRLDETYWYKHPNLSQSKDNFFDESEFQNSPYIYDHDSIHDVVALYEKPAYTSFSDGPVKVSKDSFFKLPFVVQLISVYEECCVLALERAIIPHDTDQDRAFMIALEKVCTSIASGWWREFAWENYHEVVALYKAVNPDLMKLLTDGLNDGVVKPFKH